MSPSALAAALAGDGLPSAELDRAAVDQIPDAPAGAVQGKAIDPQVETAGAGELIRR